jgi:ATP-dependent helicase HrpA
MNQRHSQLLPREPIAVSYDDSLPICAKRREIVAAIREHQTIIVAGETGSGKTTQIPKMCLEAGLGLRAAIGCTQPRRIAALSVSRRIAEELSVSWGNEVGCKIRFSDHSKKYTRIKVMTDGILLAETRSDPMLSAYEVIIIDEAHERSLNIDFLLGYLKTLLIKRPDLKLIITSATIDTELFSQAFGGAPIFEVSGRLYPVEVRHERLQHDEDEELLHYVEASVRATQSVIAETQHGDVLIFMPTERDIREACDRLTGLLPAQIEILPLMGSLSAAEQERIFRSSEKRRVIVATNIAETSITLPRIRYVIDSGLARISRYSGKQRTKRLPIERIAKSSANQRAGRAGRVQEGVCIRLYDEDDYSSRPEFTDPEILRANLAEVILRMKAFNLGDIETFPFLNAPESRAVRSGYALLQELGALDNDRQLTRLGEELARLPVDPTIARILLQGKREHTLPEVLVIAAGLSVQDPRERPAEKREKAEAAHRLFVHPDSDFLTLLNIWCGYTAELRSNKGQSQVRKFCKAHFLSYMKMREWVDLVTELRETMHIKPFEIADASAIKRFDGRYRAIHRAILTGFLGQVAFRTERNVYRVGGSREVALFPGSALAERQNPRHSESGGKHKGGRDPSQQHWIVASELLETSRVFVRMAARVQAQWIEELGQHIVKRTIDTPQWNPHRGDVLAKERVTLAGLVLAYRTVSYARLNLEGATDIFIRSTLMGDDSPFSYDFLTRNRETADKVAAYQARRGRLHRIELEERLVSFYAERLTGISSSRDFERFVKAHIKTESGFLEVSEEYLNNGEALRDESGDFPQSIKVAGVEVGLHYRYEPGSERDGVTVKLPLALAQRIPARMLDGVVPGLREQQVRHLINTLPKEYRKKIEALPDAVRRIASHSALKSMPLIEAVGSVLMNEFDVAMPAEVLSVDRLPDHLRPRIELLVGTRVATSGRDLGALVARASKEGGQDGTASLGAWKEIRQQWEHADVRTWNFSDPPAAIEVTTVSGVPMYLYPTLRVEGQLVALRLVDSQQEAEVAALSGIRRLAELLLHGEVAEMKKQVREVESLKPLLVLFCSPEQMKQQVIATALEYMLEGKAGYPLKKECFEELLAAARKRFIGLISSIVTPVKNALELRRTLIGLRRAYPGMRADLDELLPAEFPANVPFAQLQHIPRYLRCMVVRSERFDNDPQRHHQRALQLAPYVERLRNRSQKLPPDFRWMLEELKISLFAQELGTQYPISLARLDKILADAGLSK